MDSSNSETINNPAMNAPAIMSSLFL